MANTPFPTLSVTGRPDSSKFGVDLEDPSMKTQMEGGYVITRARHSRKPRRTFKVGFTEITNADKKLLEDFWDLMKGGSVVFDWINIQDGLTYAVRFKEQISFLYNGRGAYQRWDCTMVLEQA